MLCTVEPTRKTIECQILTIENNTGFAIKSKIKNDDKIAKLLAYYNTRGHNIYPIYKNDIVDNTTIDEKKDINVNEVKAFFITKFALKNKHKCDNDYDQ